jgi:hypothetical protein
VSGRMTAPYCALVLSLIVQAWSCGAPRPRVDPSPSCRTAQPLPACSEGEDAGAVDIDSLPATFGPQQMVRVRGRLVLGGATVCECRSCLISFGLASLGADSVMPRKGALLLLTAERWQDDCPFEDPAMGSSIFPGICRWSEKTGYCCPWDVSGQVIVLTGYRVPPPPFDMRPGGPLGRYCQRDERIMPASRCSPRRFEAPWRSDERPVGAFVVRRACQMGAGLRAADTAR